MSKEWIDAHRSVHETRSRLGDKWPTQRNADGSIDQEWAVGHAAVETAELLDALLRIRYTNDKRNREHRHSPNHELTQATYMFLTALGPEWDGEVQMRHFTPGVVDLYYHAGEILMAARDGVDTASYIEQWLWMAEIYSVGTIMNDVQVEMQRIVAEKEVDITEAKHGDEATE